MNQRLQIGAARLALAMVLAVPAALGAGGGAATAPDICAGQLAEESSPVSPCPVGAHPETDVAPPLPRLFSTENSGEDPDELRRHWSRLWRSTEEHARAMEQGLSVPEWKEIGDTTDALATAWQEIGSGIHRPGEPGGSGLHLAGRVSAVHYAFDHAQGQNVLYVGSVGGGLWKNVIVAIFPFWLPISSSLPGSPSVGDFAVDPRDSNRILIGTGDWARYLGDGLYRTVNGGRDWTRIVMTSSDIRPEAFFRVTLDASNPDVVLAATSSGILKSIDFGSSWTQVATGPTTDLVQDPGDVSRWLAAMQTVGILESTDSGDTFLPINGDGGTGIGQPRDRISLAISPADPSYVFALVSGHNACFDPASEWSDEECSLPGDCNPFNLCLDGSFQPTDIPCLDDSDCAAAGGPCGKATCRARPYSGKLRGIYRSSDGGTLWDPIESVDALSSGQAFHTAAIGVDPDDPDRLFVGMAWVQWTENATASGGDTVQPVMWRRIAGHASLCDQDGDGSIDLPNTADCSVAHGHADYTEFLFVPDEVSTDPLVVEANDGGVFQYDLQTNQVSGGLNLWGLRISQTMQPHGALAGSYLDPDLLLAGLQDNGMVRVDKNAPEDIVFLGGGDGGQASISPDNGTDFFSSMGLPYGRYRSADAGVTWNNVNCDAKCKDAAGEWTDVSCESDADCTPVGGTCVPKGLGSSWAATVMQDPTPGLIFAPEMFTHTKLNAWYKPVSSVCDWDEVNSTAFPEEYSAKQIDMANNITAPVFYITGWTDHRLLVMDAAVHGSVGSMTWADRTPPLPAGSDEIDSMAFADRSSLRPETVYYTTGLSRPSRAFVSDSKGLTWRNVTGSLATCCVDISFWELIGNPANSAQLFLATDVGVFRTDEGLSPSPTWYRYSDGLPAVTAIFGIEMNYDNSPTGQPVLHIGTYGRGFWERDVRNPWGGSVPDGFDVGGEPLLVYEVGVGELLLSWGPSCSVGDTDFAVYEGILQGSFDSHAPLQCSTGGKTDAQITPTAGNTYYLISPVSTHDQSQTEGSLGRDSDGRERAAAQSCHLVEVGGCP